MKREIKFRAWDTEKLYMCQVQTLADFACARVNNLAKAEAQWKRLIPLQYTGLKDKNGKEIYEGDVFPCLYAFDGCTEHVMVVEYNEPRAGFFPRWDYSKCQQKGVSKTMHDLTSLEVIGNVYENPELLTQ